jgi:hypothetical protein
VALAAVFRSRGLATGGRLAPMLLLIIIIVVVVLALGGFGFTRRR